MKYTKIPFGRFEAPKKCYFCGGSCLDICPKCVGNKTFNGKICPDCKGIGTIPCKACNGKGFIDE